MHLAQAVHVLAYSQLGLSLHENTLFIIILHRRYQQRMSL